MNKNRIVIKESELRQLIIESIQEEINEGNLDEAGLNFFKNLGKTIGGDALDAGKGMLSKAGNAMQNVKTGAQNAMQNVKTGAQNAMKNVKTGAQGMIDKADQYYTNAKERAQVKTNREDALKLIKDLKPFVDKKIIPQNIYNMISGNLRKYAETNQ